MKRVYELKILANIALVIPIYEYFSLRNTHKEKLLYVNKKYKIIYNIWNLSAVGLFLCSIDNII